MFTIIYIKFLLKILFIFFRQAMKENVALVRLSIYRNFRKLKKDQNRQASSEMASDLTMKLSDESQLLRLINEGEDGEDKGIAKELLEDDSVVDALVRIFTLRKIIYQWADSNDEKVEVLDEAIRALDASPLAESLKDISPLVKDTSKRLKSVRKELAEWASEEANDALFALRFPKKLTLKDLARLFGILIGAYLLGSYIFTLAVFKILQSNVVGLNYSDYLPFATTHNLWVLLFLLFYAWFILPEHHRRDQESYLSAEHGIPFKRYNKMEVIAYLGIIYLSIAFANIPVFQKLLGIEAEGWMQIVFFDLFILLMLILRQIPYERIFVQWYALHITLLLALMLVFYMGLNGWRLADKLKESSSTNWHYLFDDIKVTSDDYSFVYEGDSSVVFYERDSGKFFVKDKKAMKSFGGNL